MSKSNNQKSERYLPFIITASVFTAVLIAIVVAIISVSILEQGEVTRKNAEMEAQKARLANDPISVNGIYISVNKIRSESGAPALETVSNLSNAATQYCNYMVQNDFFDYKNPVDGKDSNSFISDNMGDLYYKNWVSTIFTGNSLSETASDVAKNAVAGQATNLSNPLYNSVGWATCESPNADHQFYIVGMLAEKAEKPVATQPAYVPTYSPSYYSSPTTCNTTYNDYGGYFSPTATTRCY